MQAPRRENWSQIFYANLPFFEDCVCPQIKAHYLLAEYIPCWYDRFVCLQERLNKCVTYWWWSPAHVFTAVWTTVHEIESTGLHLVEYIWIIWAFLLFGKTRTNPKQLPRRLKKKKSLPCGQQSPVFLPWKCTLKGVIALLWENLKLACPVLDMLKW